METGFWNDAKRAGEIMKELENLKNETQKFKLLEKESEELNELWKMEYTSEKLPLNKKESKSENKEEGEIRSDIEKELKRLEQKVNELEFKTLLSEPYDKNSAILSIYSGAGGVDAQDWAEMLLKMYLRWAEKNNFKAKLNNETRGQEAGIKNATLEIIGDWAYGYLKSEAGVHRLVRLSPFNANNLRQTSFALVEVLPVISEMKEISINKQDLRIDVFHSQGAGGQSVNTTDSAVRIVHLPTGIQATCQNERSQTQNKEQAMKILKAKLHKRYLEERQKEKEGIKGENISAEWGNQIRSYVLHPYKMVKDHRTQYETTQVEKVLEGEINEFIESYLKYSKK